MKAVLSLIVVVVLSFAGAFLLSPAEEVGACPQYWCDDFPRDFLSPSDTLHPCQCTWKGTLNKTCDLYRKPSGQIFVDGGPAGCDIP